MSASMISKLTSKGRVTIPEDIREELRLETGDRLEWEITGEGELRVRKLGGDLRHLVGILGKPPRPLTIEEMDRGLAEHFRKEADARR